MSGGVSGGERATIETAAGSVAALIWDSAGADAPWLHFAHATGMHAQVYAAMLAPLAARFRIVASDARGHGSNTLPADPAMLTSWRTFADDLAALLDAVDPAAPWRLAGHSMGAAVSALAATARPGRIAGLALIEPAFVPFALAGAFAALGGKAPDNPMAERAARRRDRFASRAEARAAWAGRGVFADWADADLDAYVAGGVRETADGAVLACTPAWEAATFRAVTAELETALAAVDCPVTLLAGTRASTVGDADFAAITRLPRCVRAERIADAGHFLPVGQPGRARAAIIAAGGMPGGGAG